MPELAYVNGSFCPIDQAVVSIEDRGFQFGDGIYEVAIAYGGQPFLLDRHLERFRRSAAAINLEFDFDSADLEAIVRRGVRDAGFEETLIYMQITRGVAPRNHAAPATSNPTVVMTFKPFASFPISQRQTGVSVMTTPETRWTNCYIKAITLLPNIMAKTEAKRHGFFDAIFVTAEGEARELTSANLYMVNGNRITIPPCNERVLHGITQSFTIECAKALSLEVVESPVPLPDLMAADEVFMSSTTVDVLGITNIDQKTIGKTGEVGTITQQLYAEFKRRLGEQLKQIDATSVTH